VDSKASQDHVPQHVVLSGHFAFGQDGIASAVEPSVPV
jgi:hypothetical protein